MDDLKQLDKFLKMCRKHGVESIKFDGVEVFLGQVAPKALAKRQPYVPPADINAAYDPGKITISPLPQEVIDTDELTDEQKLFYSSAPSEISQQN